MIKTCNNCSGRIVYDIEKRGIHCVTCGSTFSVKEYSVDYNSLIYEEDESIDANIYTCNSCGSEINVTDTESSTFCVYCGNPNIIFSRIAKTQKPKIIVPFEVTKEKAERIAREKLKKGFLIPKEVKNFKIDLLRGIYIPYYVTKVEYDTALIMTRTEKYNARNSKLFWYKCSFYSSLPWVITDASNKLNNDISECLEPYDLKAAKLFDEDYLLGFYSDISDANMYDAIDYSALRAEKAADEAIIKRHPSTKTRIRRKRATTMVYDKPIRALLPVWFLTYRYKDKPYTVLVNGQTGKVAGNFPWNKAAFITLTCLLGLVFTTAVGVILSTIIGLLNKYIPSFNTNLIIIAAAIFSLGILAAGIVKFIKTNGLISNYKDTSLSKFISKRQKDD